MISAAEQFAIDTVGKAIDAAIADAHSRGMGIAISPVGYYDRGAVPAPGDPHKFDLAFEWLESENYAGVPLGWNYFPAPRVKPLSAADLAMLPPDTRCDLQMPGM